MLSWALHGSRGSAAEMGARRRCAVARRRWPFWAKGWDVGVGNGVWACGHTCGAS